MKFFVNIAQVGERLKQERERIGLSQERCSELTGITRTSQSRYETGASTPGLDYLERLGELDFDVMFVIFGERAQELLPTKNPEVVSEAIDFVDELASRHGFKPPPDFRIQAIMKTYEQLTKGDHRRKTTLQDLLVLTMKK